MGFGQLSYREQILRLDQLADQALVNYPLRFVRRDLLQYEDNAVYCVTDASGKRFVLRLGAACGYGFLEQQSEMDLLAYLEREAGQLRIPHPVMNGEGKFVTALPATDPVEPQFAVLLHWVAGEVLSCPVELVTFTKLGEMTACIHSHAVRFTEAVPCIRPNWDWQRLFGPRSVLGSCGAGNDDLGLDTPQRDLLGVISKQICAHFEILASRPGFWGMIHGDLHCGNVLLEQGEVGLIDFDDCGWGFFLYDAAAILDSAYRRLARDLPEYSRLKDAYLTGYDRVRPLPDESAEHLAIFKVMRDLVTLDFILGSTNAQVQAWGAVRVQTIFSQLQAYLDHASSFGI